jgi:hypothetical protein
MSKIGSHDPFEYLKHKLWSKEGLGVKVNLTPDPLKSRISLKYMHARGVPHTIGKISTRATTLFWTSLQLEVFTRSYEPPKC